ncbi:MAG: VOC family protein [Candidatus Micrarchaeota archaeon]
MVKVTRCKLSLTVSSLKKTVAFYKSLGFKVSEDYDDWAEMQGPGLRLGLCEGKSKASDRYSIALEVNDLLKAVAFLKSKKIKYELQKEDYGCFAFFKDPDGNELYYFEECEC